MTMPLRDRTPTDVTGGLAWADRSGCSWATLDVVAGVAVVTLEGEIDDRALQPCRAALDAAFALQPDRVIIDLGRAAPHAAVTVTLLAAARRYLRTRGVSLTLACVPQLLLAALDQAQLSSLFELQPTTAVAVAVVGTGDVAGADYRLSRCP